MQNIVKCVQNLTLKETGFLWKKSVIEQDNRITVGKEYVVHSMALSGYDPVGRSEYFYEIDSDLGCRQFLHQNHFVNVSQKTNKIENYYDFRFSETEKEILLMSFRSYLLFLSEKPVGTSLEARLKYSKIIETLSERISNEQPWSDKP